MIKEFTCSGFRNITCNELSFEKINILIGPNNAGKSNFIRAMSFAANMVNNPLIEKTHFLSEVKRNGWNQIANRRNKDSSFSLSWVFQLDQNRSVKYSLKSKVGKNREENYISSESLDSPDLREGATTPYNYFECHTENPGYGKFSTAGFESAKNARLEAQVDTKESVILQMDNLFFSSKNLFSAPFVRDNIRQVLEAMRDYFKGVYSYSCTSFNIAAIRDMRNIQDDGSVLNKDGSNFLNVYYQMVNADQSFKERFKHMLRKLVMNCDEISIKEAGEKIWMELKMNGFSFPLSEVSDGTIHLLILVLLLSLSEKKAISLLAIDEPEMNLHPAWQKLLAHEILSCRGFKQCFISTHSPEFLDEFTESFLEGSVAVFVFDPARNETIKQLNRYELSNDLQNWTLGDLYRIGDPVIGGWPQ